MDIKKLVPELRFSEFESNGIKIKLDCCTSFILDGTHFSPVSIEQGEYKYITSKNIKNGYLDLSNIQFVSKKDHKKIYSKCPVVKGDVLLTKDGASVGNCCINHLEEEFSLLSSVAVIRGIPEKIINHYLFYFLQSPSGKTTIRKSVSGQAITRITLTQIKKFNLYLYSLKEQQKIANFLIAIDQRIILLKQKKTALEQYKKGLMQKIFSQEIRFKAHGSANAASAEHAGAAKDDEGNEFPDWVEKRFNELYEFKRTNSLSRDKLNYEKGEVYNIHYGDIHTKFNTHFESDKENVPYVNSEIDLRRIKDDEYIQTGDLVIADASEDYNDIGKAIEISQILDQKIIAGLHTFLARRINNKLAEGFGGFIMQSEKVRLQIKKIAQGTKVLGISMGRLAKIRIELPCPEEQQKIANFLSDTDKKIIAMERQIIETETFKKGLLQKMFV